MLSLVTAELQTANVAYFQRKIQLSGFFFFASGSPSQLILISGVLLYVRSFRGTLQFSVAVKPRVHTLNTKTRFWPLLDKLCIPPHPQKVCLRHYLNTAIMSVWNVFPAFRRPFLSLIMQKQSPEFGNNSYIDKADITIRRKNMLHSFAVKVSYLRLSPCPCSFRAVGL